MDFVIVLVVLVVVVLVVSAPLLRRGDAPRADDRHSERPALEAAREAKYREIREADLDHRMGKLSDADHDAIDSTLRAEAMEILRGLDEFEDPSRSLPKTKGADDGESDSH